MPAFMDPSCLDAVGNRRRNPAFLSSKRKERSRLVLERAELLSPRDRVLIRMRHERDITLRDLADLFELHAGSISRRLQSLERRLTSAIVDAALHPATPFPRVVRQAVLANRLRRRPLADLADELGWPVTQLRAQIRRFEAWVAGRRDGIGLVSRTMQLKEEGR